MKLIFFGDSILEHSQYVREKQTLEYKLADKYGKDNIFMIAMDNAKIRDVYNQLNNLKEKINKRDVFFLSIGGNDILEKINDKSINKESIDGLYQQHRKLVKYIKSNFDCKLYIVTIYKPPFKQFYNYHPYINQWNQKIVRDYNDILYLHETCTRKSHFVDYIEPSSECVELMLKSIDSALNS